LYSGIVVMALVCGGLMIFFLTPTQKGVNTGNFQQNVDMSFSEAFRASFIHTIFHKKALLAFLQLVITLIIIWQFHVDLEWYNGVHGVISSTAPIKQAVLYMIAGTVYAVMICIVLVGRGTIKLIKKSG